MKTPAAPPLYSQTFDTAVHLPEGGRSVARSAAVMKKHPLIIVALVAAVAVAAALGLSLLMPANVQAPVEPGTTLISLSPPITETLFEIGAGDQVVGRSDYCDFPPQVKDLPPCGSALQANAEAIIRLRAGLIDYLDKGVGVKELRRRAARVFDGPKRVLKPESERRPILRRWPLTIADVYIPDRPQGAAERVRRWAAAIRGEL